MKAADINIRDPFILSEDGVYYLYGTSAKNFGRLVGGFDVYTSTDLENWSEAHECFNSEKYSMNKEVNWAPRFTSITEITTCSQPLQEKISSEVLLYLNHHHLWDLSNPTVTAL